MKAFGEGESRELLVLCTGDEESADFLTRLIEGIEGRALTDPEIRVLALGVRFGRIAQRAYWSRSEN